MSGEDWELPSARPVRLSGLLPLQVMVVPPGPCTIFWYRSKKGSFAPFDEVDDWLETDRESSLTPLEGEVGRDGTGDEGPR